MAFDVFAMVLAAALAGLALGIVSVRFLETLSDQVKATDVRMLTIPSLASLAAAFLASLPTVIHPVRIDPVETVRSE